LAFFGVRATGLAGEGFIRRDDRVRRSQEIKLMMELERRLEAAEMVEHANASRADLTTEAAPCWRPCCALARRAIG